MKFWASSESHAPADVYLERTRRLVEPYMEEELEKSVLSKVDLLIRYIPIVMPVAFHDKYTERSKARIKQRIYDCAPHLNYEIFTIDDFDSQVADYLRGISLSTPHLHKFGLTQNDIDILKEILAAAPARLSVKKPTPSLSVRTIGSTSS